MFELYILELPKFEKYKTNSTCSNLNLWIDFIKNPRLIDMSNKKENELTETEIALKEARKILEDISSNPKERYIAELREKYILD